ncbi:MoaD/ThiS family protein [Glycomyces xiaoerkulensis]|uniref:MoaD/ThiS family protein n=1 Tax=Glycomyces xiaoerkulensis TaxID=2038139 RepID=UPI000C257EA9|nr:MoaD/ThiS family protein [Glycomyces xiaoerkulensis]
MHIDLKIPAALASECGGARAIAVEVPDGANLGDLLDAVAADYPRLARRVRDEAGQLRRFVNVYVGDDESRRLEGQATPLKAGQPVQILPSIAGG